MKLTSTICLALGLVYSFASMASLPKCRIEVMILGGDQLEISVQSPEETHRSTIFKGHNISAEYIPSTKYEPQSSLHMRFDKLRSRIYQVNKNSTYVLEWDGLRFQCWFENH